MKKTLLMAMTSALLASLPSFTAEPAPLPDFLIGATTHFAQSKGDRVVNLPLFKALGLRSLRDEFHWSGVETQKGVYNARADLLAYVNQAAESGIIPLIILDYANAKFYDSDTGYPTSDEGIQGYINYCDYVMTVTAGKARIYQLWNEWDGGCGMHKYGPGNLDAYMKLIKRAYPVLKAKHPEAVIIANSVCRGDKVLEYFMQNGLAEVCDGVSLHTYNYRVPDDPKAVEKWYARVQSVREMLAQYNNGTPKPLYITEMGYPNFRATGGSTYEDSAAKLSQMYLLARTLPFLKGIWWYDFQDDGWDVLYNENNFGLVRPDLTPKPAALAVKNLSPLISEGTFLEEIPIPDNHGRLLRFQLGKEQVLAAWCTEADSEIQFLFENTSENLEPVTVQPVLGSGTPRLWGYRDWVANRRNTAVPNQLAVSASAMPVLLRGNLDKVKLVSATLKPSAPQGSSLPVCQIGTDLNILPFKNMDFAIPFGSDHAVWEPTLPAESFEFLQEDGVPFVRVTAKDKRKNYQGFHQLIDLAPIQKRLKPGEKLNVRLTVRYRWKNVVGRGFTMTINSYDNENNRKFREISYVNGDSDGWQIRSQEMIPVLPNAVKLGLALNIDPETTGVCDIDFFSASVFISR